MGEVHVEEGEWLDLYGVRIDGPSVIRIVDRDVEAVNDEVRRLRAAKQSKRVQIGPLDI